MKETVEGIILNETNYSETSKILNILTPKYGYISVMSKGCRTIKSRLRGISMKLVYGEFTITYKPKGISNLIEGSLVNSLKNIMTDFLMMNYATKCIDITKNVLKDNNDSNIFYILKDCLIKINENFNPKIIYMILAIKLLDYLGVKPNFTTCVNCGNNDILTFDLSIPGSICKNCYHDTYLFHPNTLKLLKLFQVVDINKIDKLNITNTKILEELEYFLKEYYDSYTGIYFNVK